MCGLSLGMLDGIFSEEDLRLAPITDEKKVLDVEEIGAIRNFMQDFHQSFPQLILMVYLGHFPGKMEVGVRETAFWLGNRARSSSFSFRPRRCTLMLYVDTQQKRAVLNAGYGFETLVEEEELKEVLNQGRRYFRGGEYSLGILCTLSALSAVLISKASSRAQQEVRYS
jgi:hypothetical protein